MSAERLRAAAALMRERAEVWEYHRGPWRTTPGAAGHTVVRCDTEVPADEFGPGGSMDTFVVDCDTTTTATHIASWHPVVALAVADWLDDQAEVSRRVFLDVQRPSAGVDQPPAIHYGDVKSAAVAADHHTRHALAVANAYLGKSS